MAGLLCFAALYAFSDEGFLRYQPILDKRPFSQEIFSESDMDTHISRSFVKSMRLSMLVRGADGCFLAGIIDQDSGKSYVLKLREPQNGLELIFGDTENSEAMIRMGSKILSFKLEADKTSAVFESSVQLAQEVRVLELSRPIRVETPEPSASGLAFQKYLESVQADSVR